VTLDDSLAAVITNDSGAFRVVNVLAGGHTVLVRRIGFVPVATFFHSDRNELVVRDFSLKQTVDTLPRVVVVGDAGEPLTAKLIEFQRRKAFGIGRFLGPSDLAKRDGELTGSVLRLIPGLIMRRGSGSAQYAVNPRGAGGIRGQGANNCPVTVYVDGALSSDQFFNVNSLQISELSAIEYYAGPAQAPAQYSRPGLPCGVLLFWTK
jgi:hypothetical protein